MKNLSSKLAVLLICYFAFPAFSYAQSHLLLSEVGLQPASGEFIEIYNPSNAAISLDNYYLADNAYYATYHSTPVSLDNSDFIVRFPAGSIIQPNQVMVVVFNSTDFATAFPVIPDFEITSMSITIPDMISVAVTGSPTLTNSGEGIILFYWDGLTDLVQDVDMLNAGVPSIANMITSKTGIAIDGPDVDALATSYLPDAGTIPLQSSAPAPGFSTKRILLETGFEIATGGNGITGNDETSENITLTWDAVFTASDPGTSVLTTGTGIILYDHYDYHVFPNPFSNQLTFTLSDNEPTTVSLYDFLGHQILHETFTNFTTINTAQLANGIYFYELRNDKGALYHGKILRQ